LGSGPQVPLYDFFINGGMTYAASSSVILQHKITDYTFGPFSLAYVCATENSSLTDCLWQPLRDTTLWQLSPGFGKKTVYVQYKSPTVLSSPVVSRSITYVPADVVSNNLPVIPVRQSSSVVFSQTLQMGSRGQQVKRLQQLLASDASIYPGGAGN
jgi:hypothetical protein